MARETKVGLLAGLAFIVCFAVILTNSGQRDPLPASSRTADASRRQAAVRTPSPARHQAKRQRPRSGMPTTAGGASGKRPAVRFGSATPPGHQAKRPANPEWRRTVPATEYQPQLRPAHGADAGLRDQPIRSPSTSLSSRPSQLRDAVSRTTSSSGALNEQLRPASNHGPADAPGTAQPANPRRSTSPAQHTTRDRSPAPTQTKRRAVLTNYTVAPGDTLTRIAAHHYGKASRRFINAIVAANRSAIADPDKLRAGIDLVIPSVDGSAVVRSSGRPATDVAAADRRATERPPRSGRPGGYRWYQIKKNDRYISIAREQLGDASRWEEIYELNTEKFPDAGMIREGVRIKLPMDQSASAGRRR